MNCNRRVFLGAAAGLAAGHMLGTGAESARASESQPGGVGTPLLGNRFVTFNSIIRVNQIEVSRNRNVGNDEVAEHTPENVRAMREAFERGWPGGKMTWAFSWLALQDKRDNYRAIRDLVVEYHRRYGDEITFIPGAYFANAYNTREQVNRDLHEGLAMACDMVGGGYRPRSVVAGFLSAANQKYLAEREGIHVCQGNIWSQYDVDNQDGDGSICYPFYPSTEHFCKPAQGKDDFIDSVNLDGWTCDFLAARRAGGAEGFNSRMGVGPIETIGGHGPEKGLRQMVATTACHFDRGFELNRFGWITNCWEVCLVKQIGHIDVLTRWFEEIRRRWSKAICITQGEFGLIWRAHFRDNRAMDYRFVQRGSGIGGSDADKEIRWFMNPDFRLALLRNWQNNSPEQVIDFTRYDLKAEEPKTLTRRWSLMGRINQKRTRPQDAPVPLSKLEPVERELIGRRYPELLAP